MLPASWNKGTGKSFKQIHENNTSTKYFAAALKIHSLLLLTPFTINWDSSSNRFQLETRRIRQFVCGILHFCSVCLLLKYGGDESSQTDPSTSEIEYVVHKLGFLLQLISLLWYIKLLWVDQSLIILFLNTEPYINVRIVRQKVYIILFLYWTFIFYDAYKEDWHFSKYLQDELFIVGFLPTNLLSSTTAQVALNAIKTICYVLLFVIPTLFGYANEGFCTALAMDHLEICRNLVKRLSPETKFREGVQLHKEHRQSLQALNKFSSSLFLLSLLNSMVYFSQMPLVYHFNRPNFYEQVTMVIYIIITAIMWGCAGGYHAISRRAIKRWITKKQDSANISTPIHEQFQLAALSQNLDSDPIAIDCLFFHTTYGFEISMVGLLISYNIVIFQMEQQGRTSIKASSTP